MSKISDRNVYILGAGASAGAGAPLIHGFLDTARQLYDQPFSGLEPFEQDHFKRVFDFRREMAQSREKVQMDLDDIEQLFGLVEISHRLRETPLETRNSMVYLIAKTLQMSINNPMVRRPRLTVPCQLESTRKILNSQYPYSVDEDYLRIDIYDYFAGLIMGAFDDPDKRRSRRDTIITFNYDLVCEHAFRRFGIEADYGLDADSLDDQRESADKGSVPILKLHGSTNWGICGACNKRVVILSNKLTDSPREFRNMTCPDCKANTMVPLLIPPSWDKSGYAEIISPVWKRAVDELKSASRICIIGYSIPETDSFFKYLITMALADNHQLYKLIVVDYRSPTRSDPASLDNEGYKEDLVKPRYQKLLDTLFQERRFLYFDRGFFEFLREYWSRFHLGRCEMLINGDFGW